MEYCEAIKASLAADLNKIKPDSFSSIIPSDVPDFGFRAVSRSGAPPMNNVINKVNVPAEFQHLLSNMEESDD